MSIDTFHCVLLPIEVPKGRYCWDGHVPCPKFDNYREVRCRLGIGEPEPADEGYLKPQECMDLEVVEE